MADERVQRRLAAILAADVVGYSRLMGEDEVGTRQRFNAHLHELIEPAIANRQGRIVKTTGDALLIEFASVVDAVQCAVEIQKGMVDRNTHEVDGRRMEFRIGVNLGDVIIEGDDIHGDGVNVAARLEGLAEPGGLCVSAKVVEEVRNKLEVSFEDMGPQTVKNIAEPVRTHRVRIDSGVSTMDSAKPDNGHPLPLPDKPSIAVLPFLNMSGDPEQEYFADGIAEDIITGLSRIRWFFVIARNSSFTYKGKAVDVRQVGRELGVRYVLEGSVRKSSNRIRINAQLIDAATGNHLWADKFDGELSDVFDLQDQITTCVVGSIEPSIREAEIERSRRKPPESLDAYDLYLRALPHAYEYFVEGWRQAISLVDQALELEPNYAEAHGLGAWCHWHLFLHAGCPESQEPMLAHAGAVRELRTTEAAPLAYAALALAHFAEHRKTALGMVDRALAHNGNSMHANAIGAVINVFIGQWEAAILLAEEALRLSPFDPTRYMACAAISHGKYMLDDLSGAEAGAREALQINPRHLPSLLLLATILVDIGQLEEARAVSSDILIYHPNFHIGHYGERTPLGVEIYNSISAALRTVGLPA